MAESALLHAYGYLTQPEIRFLDAAVERLIPIDELGPGAKEAGVTCHTDIQLQPAQVDAQGFAKHIMLKQVGSK